MATFSVIGSGDGWAVLKSGKKISSHRLKRRAIKEAKRAARKARGDNKLNVFTKKGDKLYTEIGL